MTEKRFKLKDYGYDGWAVEDTTGEIFENDYIEDMSDQQVVDTLNELHEENQSLKFQLGECRNNKLFSRRQLEKENEQLKQELQEIQDGFELNWTQNRVEYNKDKLYIKDTNTEICLNGTNLSIRTHIPSLNEYYQFKYKVTGRSLMKEFIEKYNSKSDDETD